MKQTKCIGICVLVLILATFSAVPVAALGPNSTGFWVDPVEIARHYSREVEIPRMLRLLAYLDSTRHGSSYRILFGEDWNIEQHLQALQEFVDIVGLRNVGGIPPHIRILLVDNGGLDTWT